jgi:hypothetical protein
MACSWCRKEGHVITECEPTGQIVGHLRAVKRKLEHALRVMLDSPAVVTMEPWVAEAWHEEVQGFMRQVSELETLLGREATDE